MDYTTPSESPSVNYGLWPMMMYNSKLISCKNRQTTEPDWLEILTEGEAVQVEAGLLNLSLFRV